ncbi:MAG: beta-N-acetylhexosaminidase [Cytophagales bacterium]|nr:beta-N-acetylhexosaminidase [Armatimonadota bacterium]
MFIPRVACWALLAGAGLFIGSRPAGAAPVPLSPLTANRLTVGWTAENGLTVAVDGVPLVRRSSLVLVKKGWTGTLLNQARVKPDITDWTTAPDGTRTARIRLENEDAACEYLLTVSPKNRLVVDLAYRLKRDTPAEIEYAAGYLSGAVLQGSRIEEYVAAAASPEPGAAAVSAKRQVSLAPPAAGTTQEQNRLGPPLQSVAFGTRLGEVTIRYSGDAPAPVLFDGRADKGDWAANFPLFWLGIGSPSPAVAKRDGERHAVFTFLVTEKGLSNSPAKAAGSSEEGVALYSAATFVPTLSARPLVIPRPKVMTVRDNSAGLRLSKTTRLVLPDASPAARKAARLLSSEIEQRFGFSPKVVLVSRGNPLLGTGLVKDAIFLGIGGKSEMLSGKRIPVPQKPEGYAVAVGPSQALIAGTDEAGVLWGAQTLIQLLAADAKGPLVRPVVIQDWPTLSVRSVHLFHGREALPFHQKLIDRVLARFKMNALFIQAEQVRWDADPAVAPDWAGTKADLRKEIAFAAERGMTVYPLLESYGHMEWLFNKGGNTAFAEDPQTPYAVNISDPRAMAYLEKFNAEADTLFDAPGFHAGLDEVTMRGRFPYRSLPRTFPDLFVSNAKYWHEFAIKRNKPLWMWADMALHPSEVAPCFGTAPTAKDAAAVRAGLPKDIVMVDWQYSPHDSYPSLKVLKNAGFRKLVAATWYYPQGIQDFTRAAAQIGALGGMQVTWCGYESKESVLDTLERRQFTAMVLAADYFWNGGDGPAPSKLPYDFSQVFARQWRGAVAADSVTRPGVAAVPALTMVSQDWLGYGPEGTLTGIPVGDVRLSDGIRYRFPARPASAVLLRGKLNPPGTGAPSNILLPLTGEKTPGAVRELHLVLAASHQAASGTRIGTVSLTAADGTTTKIELIYGRNIAAWNDPRSVPDAPVMVRGKTSTGEEALLRALVWRQEKGTFSPVSATLTSDGTEAAPVLFATAAVN